MCSLSEEVWSFSDAKNAITMEERKRILWAITEVKLSETLSPSGNSDSLVTSPSTISS